MAEGLKFDYYYGNQAEQFTFYRVPKLLIKDKRFAGLSSDAKLLYGLMLDRMSLSMSNEWFDEENRAYIIYTTEQIIEDLGCARQKAVKVSAELDSERGIGLIERKRRGLGKPDIIYVKNFILEDENVKKDENPKNADKEAESNFKKYENHTSESMEIKTPQVSKSNSKEYENHTLESMEIKSAKVWDSDSNNTKKNQTKESDNDLSEIQPSENEDGRQDESHLILSCANGENQTRCLYQPLSDEDEMDKMGQIISYIHERIEYPYLIQSYRSDMVDGLVNIMAECIASDAEYIIIKGAKIPQRMVRKAFEKYDYSIMEYVLGCLKENTTKIKNIKAYLLAVLYNAPMTIDQYYISEVRHDMAYH